MYFECSPFCNIISTILKLCHVTTIIWRRRWDQWLFLAVLESLLRRRRVWSQYVERLEQFYIANYITAGKKKSILLSTISLAAYHTLCNLIATKKPSEETFTNLVEHMSKFYNPKPLVTMQRYRSIVNSDNRMNLFQLLWQSSGV